MMAEKNYVAKGNIGKILVIRSVIKFAKIVYRLPGIVFLVSKAYTS